MELGLTNIISGILEIVDKYISSLAWPNLTCQMEPELPNIISGILNILYIYISNLSWPNLACHMELGLTNIISGILKHVSYIFESLRSFQYKKSISGGKQLGGAGKWECP